VDGLGSELTFFCNQTYVRDTLGAKYPWALGQPAARVWEEIWDDIGPRIETVMTTGQATWDESLLLFLERSGYVEETYHTFSYSPLTGDDGQVQGMLCVVTEDTERVIGARRLTTLRDLSSALAAATTEAEMFAAAQAPIAANAHSLPFTLTYLLDEDNRTARLAMSTGIRAGHPAAPAMIDISDSDAPWPVAEVAVGENVLIDELPARFADLPTGAWDVPPLQAMVVALEHPGDQLPYGVMIAGLNRFRPVDQPYRGYIDLIARQLAGGVTRARAFDAARRQTEELAELDRVKTAFFTNISHELRTPLTLLLGPTQDALDDDREPLPAGQRARLEVVERNAQRLLKQVNTLLDFSRLQSGRASASYEPLELGEYTAELAAMFQPTLERAGLSFTITCDAPAEAVYVDRDMWAKIVLNLLSNAFKATFDGGISVTLTAQADGVVLAVTDTGVGIEATQQARLFERFHRVAGAASRSYEGSGIGLALVAEFAALHGGTVAVTSTPGQGSTFSVRLPYGTDHLPPEQVASDVRADAPQLAQYGAGYLAETSRWLDNDDAPDEPAPTGRRRMLVVDDNPDMRDYITGLLTPLYDVETAPDGAVALRQARAHPPDLVLTDVMMPELDGYGLLLALRADPRTTHVPVVMLSARAGDNAAVEGLEAGADDYLVKPFAARELLARVRANLELDRVRRVAEELEDSRALLDHAEQLASVGSWEIDLASGSITGSAELSRIVGIGSRGLQEQGLAAALERVHPDDVAATEAAVLAAAAGEAPLDIEVRLHPVSSDSERRVRVRGVLRRDDDGRPIKLRGSAQDVTDQRQAERELLAAAAQREAAAREHHIAEQLQRSLLPERTFDPGQLDVATYYRAGVEGTQVGGDWYDVIELGRGRTALVLGDVMGRGVQAAAVMGQLRATVRAYARLDLAPVDVLHLLDAAVQDVSSGTIVTCIYAVYDPEGHALSYANAGHLPPLLSVPGQPVLRLTAGGPPLGSGLNEVGGETVHLPAGTLLALYTDGLVEHRGSDLDVGIDRLAQLLTDPGQTVEGLPGRLVEALLPEGPDDDVAVLIVRTTADRVDARAVVRTIANAGDAVGQARDFAAQTLRSWAVDESVTQDAVLIISELVTNALAHGRPPVELRLRHDGDHLTLDIHDADRSTPRKQHAAPDEDHGRGLSIVAALAHAWGTRLTPDGKSVWCTLALPAGSPSR
jgi:signal transduction histidine kinase/serine phosphatase RsbU (regulator of sigma subunit)/DNA-binding response OmpR family regulator